MMKTIQILVLGLIISLSSCASDKITASEINCDDEVDVTYTNEVAAIINTGCAYSGCHAGDQTPDLSNYEIVANYLNNKLDKFNQRTFVNKDMPPEDATPSELTAAQLNTLQCWIENGFPE